MKKYDAPCREKTRTAGKLIVAYYDTIEDWKNDSPAIEKMFFSHSDGNTLVSMVIYDRDAKQKEVYCGR